MNPPLLRSRLRAIDSPHPTEVTLPARVSPRSRGPSARPGAAALLLVAAVAPGFGHAADAADANALIRPDVVIVDHGLPKKTLAAQLLAARRYDTFWNTGDAALARAALAPDFRDNTPPAGRAPGVAGVLAASSGFRTAVPDLRCEVRQMLVAGDRVVAHLHFTGHFTGTFMGKTGSGQPIDFIATDIYRVADGRIAEDWHLEDNLAFLQQAGLVPR